ncbi:hypothetical protein ROZALSC1DRAFT_27684 [Rozella allomycis CSF55]|uniref:Uncharacterized protein n=1 Tax=Rozella allomycis (strain CSF55) TaxID=988480 RepID=A0A4P9YNN4_ROZAC|nr:hypothetical protein ROZALSC1DRAFT_27684 [Rozella allomycis CSF55]
MYSEIFSVSCLVLIFFVFVVSLKNCEPMACIDVMSYIQLFDVIIPLLMILNIWNYTSKKKIKDEVCNLPIRFIFIMVSEVPHEK